jgi:predicted transcriptional regulator of viral defense system
VLVTSKLDAIRTDTFRFRDARALGIQSRDLGDLVAHSEIRRVGRGIYRKSTAMVSDLNLVEIASRAPMSTICLTAALARHDLIDAIPPTLDVALPRGSRHPKTTAPVRWHSFDTSTFDIGRQPETIDGTDLTIGVYSAERCIVDAFRMRGYVGYEIAREALGNWLRIPGSRPAKLLMLAQRIPRSEGPLRTALEFMS